MNNLRKLMMDNNMEAIVNTIQNSIDSIQRMQSDLIELDDLMEYSKKYTALKLDRTKADYALLEDGTFSLNIFEISTNKNINIVAGLNPIEDEEMYNKFIIETTCKYDISNKIMKLPKALDALDTRTISSITIYYNNIFVVCSFE